MRYSLQPKYRKYVQDHGFLSFARTFGNKYGKKLVNTGISSAKKISPRKYGKKIIDTTKKEWVNFGKIVDKRILTKSAEATGDLIGNNIADKITSLGNKSKNEKSKEQQEQEEIIIPSEKRQRIIDDLRLLSS